MAKDSPGRGPWKQRAFVAAAFAIVLGCGARAMVDGAEEGDADEPGPGATGVGAAGGTGGTAGARAPSGGEPVSPFSIDVGSTPLPDCEPGFPPSAALRRECTYIYQDLCYEGSLEACACACSGPRANRCIIGGFLNPDEPQTVSCTAQ
jgi:hypothetical protein